MTIAHRFALAAPGGWHVPGATSWDAYDTRLDARVTVLVSDSADAESVLARLTQVRAIRDPRFARIVDVGIVDIPHSGEAEPGQAETSRVQKSEPRAYVAVAALTGITAEALVALRIVPASLARLLVRGTAEALDAASAAGIAHGALSSAAIGVNNRGRLIVAGAGLLDAFGGDARKADAADAGTLASLFARAVLGFESVDDDGDVVLPDDLVRRERRIVTQALRGKGPASVAELVAALGSTDGATLSGLRTQLRGFPPILAPEPEVAEPEPLELDEGAVAEPHERVASPIASPPKGATREEIEEWELEHLLEEKEAEEVPTLAEAILDFLHRRFPTSDRITGYLEAAHAGALRGPRVNGTRWTVLVLLVLLGILGYAAVHRYQTPYVPTGDLNNPPGQTYPPFTLGPSTTAATPTP